MKAALRLFCVLSLSMVGTVAARAAHTHAPTPSTWTLNVKASDFGGGPSMKSDVMVILTDTEKWLKFTDVTVDGDGKTWRTSWSGPQDGSFKPVAGMPGAKAAFKAADDTSVFIMGDGTEFDCTFSMEAASKKVMQDCTVKAKGKTATQKLVYDRTR